MARTSSGPAEVSRFVLHRHRTARVHFDLRLVVDGRLRSWSLLREPGERAGEQRLAVERESLEPADIDLPRYREEAFGEGAVSVWDRGEARVAASSDASLLVDLRGQRLSGRYELRRTRWYPGNRWLLRKLGDLGTASD